MSARAAILVCSAAAALISACSEALPAGTIYFVSERAGRAEAWRVRPDGSGEARVLGGGDAVYPYGASPDRSQIAFVISHGERDELALADPDGKNARALAPSEDGLSWYPAHSPDGAWILFESSRDAFRELYKVSTASGEL